MAIIDEPVRGNVPPAWFTALPGLDRMRALANGQVVRPPLFRLLAIQVGHVAPGSVTLTMPASGWLLNGYGVVDLHQLVEAALTAASTTALPVGMELETAAVSIHHMRPGRPDAGTFIARARVVNASRLLIYAEVEVEDANGRRIVQGSAQARPRTAETPSPSPPSPLRRVEEPEYSTADPLLRPVPPLSSPPANDLQSSALDQLRGFVDSRFRSGEEQLVGIRTLEIERDYAVCSMPASPWSTLFGQSVSAGSILLVGNVAGSMACLTNLRPEAHFAGLDQHLHLFRPLAADGRDFRVTAESYFSDGLASVRAEIEDADGNRVGQMQGAGVFVDEAAREKRHRTETRRVLATLLFADVVDSTAHADRLGDARWRELLGEFRSVVRAAIARNEGVEIDTAGDGFFVRFESPGAAIACARAVRDNVKRLGIEVRSGIHTGECELEAGKPTGMAVHAAARIQGKADPGEILVSETVKALAAGAGLRFEDRGSHELKGVPERWALHAVDPAAA